MHVTCVERCVVTSDVTVWPLIMSRGVVSKCERGSVKGVDAYHERERLRPEGIWRCGR